MDIPSYDPNAARPAAAPTSPFANPTASDLPPDPNPGLTFVERADGTVEVVEVAYRPTDTELVAARAVLDQAKDTERRAFRRGRLKVTASAAVLWLTVIGIHVAWAAASSSPSDLPSGGFLNAIRALVTFAIALVYIPSLLIAAAFFTWMAAAEPEDPETAKAICLYAALGSTFSAVVVINLLPDVDPAWAWLLVAVYAAAAFYRFVVHRSFGAPLIPVADRGPAKAARLLLARDYLDMDRSRRRVWGTPGQGADAVAKFGQANTDLGRFGERAVAGALETAFTDPEYRFFHSLRFPGSAKADIDHAVLLGGRVALLDAKAWKVGHYSWHRDGYLLRDGAPFPGGDNHLLDALAGFHAGALKGLDLASWIVLVPVSNRTATVDNSLAPAGVRLATIDEAIAEVRHWLDAPGDEARHVDRNAMLRLMGQLKFD